MHRPAVRPLAVLTLLLSVAAGGCPTDNAELGEKGRVLFNAIGDYSGTTGLSSYPICLSCTMFIEMSDPEEGQDSLLADLRARVEPSDRASLVELGGGRVLVIPRQSGGFNLVAERSGEFWDTIRLRSESMSSLDVADGLITTYDPGASEFDIVTEPVPLTGIVELGVNQQLGFTLIPRDADGDAMMGLVPWTVPPGTEDTFEVDATVGAFPGQTANRLRFEPRDNLAGPADIQIVDMFSSREVVVPIDMTGEYVELP